MEIAILMAAGLGTRMRPITEYTPKPLVKVGGVPMIETVIEGLLKQKIGKIYIVVGYLKEQFSYLEEKYPNIEIVENEEYAKKNNISSIYAVRNILGTADCYICEADLCVRDNSIFEKKHTHSCYYGRMVEGYSADWQFQLENGRIVWIGKGGTDQYNMVGISYFRKEDAAVISEAVKAAYRKPGHETLFWDEVVNGELGKLNLKLCPVLEGQVVEIDTVEELDDVERMIRFSIEC